MVLTSSLTKKQEAALSGALEDTRYWYGKKKAQRMGRVSTLKGSQEPSTKGTWNLLTQGHGLREVEDKVEVFADWRAGEG